MTDNIKKEEIDKFIKECFSDPNFMAVMKGLQEYDSRYIGNVSREDAIKLGLFKEDEI